MRYCWLLLLGLTVGPLPATGQTRPAAAEIADMQRWAKPVFSGGGDTTEAPPAGNLAKRLPFSFKLGGVFGNTAAHLEADSRQSRPRRQAYAAPLDSGRVGSGHSIGCDPLLRLSHRRLRPLFREPRAA